MNIKFMERLIIYLFPIIFVENYFIFTKKRFPGVLNIFKNNSFFCHLAGKVQLEEKTQGKFSIFSTISRLNHFTYI